MNTEPEYESDQFGSSGGAGTVTIVSVTRDGDNIKSFHITFSGIEVSHSASGNTLCLNNGLLKTD